MALPFRRSSGSADGEQGAPLCSASSPAQRLWEVRALLSSLSPEVQKALLAWLLMPTDLNRWPPPTSFSRRRAPIQPDDLDDDVFLSCRRLLYKELKAMRQTLDFPWEAMSGLTRNGLLVAHGIRLRQLEGWLWPFYAAREITGMIA